MLEIILAVPAFIGVFCVIGFIGGGSNNDAMVMGYQQGENHDR